MFIAGHLEYQSFQLARVQMADNYSSVYVAEINFIIRE